MSRSIDALGAALRAREVGVVELTRQTLADIDRWEPQLQACLGDLRDRALAQAERLQQELADGVDRGPLHGIPIGIKDLIDIAGVPTTAGSAILRDNIARTSAPVVERLEQAGAVLVAKTNTHEFAFGALTPPTRNPHDTTRMPGGSSGGSAALVGAGIVPAALGTDTGGSIREPAALCGAVGLKPTYGRTDLRGIVPLAWSLDTVGPIAGTTADARSVFEAMKPSGPERDLVRGSAARGSAPAVCRPIDTNGLRIGVWTEMASRFGQGVRDVYDATLDALADAGAHVVPLKLGDPDQIVAATIVVLGAEALSYHRQWLDTRRDEYTEDVLGYLDLSATFTAEDLVGAQRVGAAFTDRVDRRWVDIDVLLSPAQLVVPPTVEDDEVVFDDGRQGPRDLTLIRPLAPFNLSGHPAVSVPVGHETAGGFPISVQLVGPRGTEFGLLDVGTAVQEACAYAPRWPSGPL